MSSIKISLIEPNGQQMISSSTCGLLLYIPRDKNIFFYIFKLLLKNKKAKKICNRARCGHRASNIFCLLYIKQVNKFASPWFIRWSTKPMTWHLRPSTLWRQIDGLTILQMLAVLACPSFSLLSPKFNCPSKNSSSSSSL